MDQIWLPRPNIQLKIPNSARIKLDGNVLDIYFRKEILATFFKTVTYLLDDTFTASDMKQAMRCTKYDTASPMIAYIHMLFWEFEQADYVYDKWFEFANNYVQRL